MHIFIFGQNAHHTFTIEFEKNYSISIKTVIFE
jgi:hypothetical protein